MGYPTNKEGLREPPLLPRGRRRFSSDWFPNLPGVGAGARRF